MNFKRQKTWDQCVCDAAKRVDRLDAELLASHVLKQPREYLLAHGDERAPSLSRVRFRSLVRKRAYGVPLAYLVGEKEFFGLDFFVNRHVLIPRPETETLVETVLTELRTMVHERRSTVLVDVGTGSGCIPISILKQIPRQTLKAFATDISRTALRVAKRNALRHEIDIAFSHGDLLEPISTVLLNSPRIQRLIITANLPYLTDRQYTDEPSIQHEPKRALVSKKNGLDLYERLLGHLKELRARISPEHQCEISAFFEIDPSQSSRMVDLVQRYFRGARPEIHKDLRGQDRVMVCIV